MFGESVDVDAEFGEGERFLARSVFRLPVGWECIEIFPFFDLEQWKPEFAPLWAENDLLAAVVAHQNGESKLQSLDQNVKARRQYEELLDNFKKILDSNPPEETLQIFLNDNPALLCPTRAKVWPKLALGARKTDFVFREAAGDYLLVELETSSHRLFLKDGHQSSQLGHARGQILDWKRYLEDNLSEVDPEIRTGG